MEVQAATELLRLPGDGDIGSDDDGPIINGGASCISALSDDILRDTIFELFNNASETKAPEAPCGQADDTLEESDAKRPRFECAPHVPHQWHGPSRIVPTGIVLPTTVVSSAVGATPQFIPPPVGATVPRVSQEKTVTELPSLSSMGIAPPDEAHEPASTPASPSASPKKRRRSPKSVKSEKVKELEQSIELERSAFHAERAEITAERDALKAQLDTANSELDALKAERDVLKSELDASNSVHDALKTERDALKSELDASSSERDALKVELDALKAKRAGEHDCEALEKLRSDIENSRKTLDAARQALKDERAKVAADREVVEHNKQSLDAARKEFDVERAKLDTERAELKLGQESLRQSNGILKSKRTYLIGKAQLLTKGFADLEEQKAEQEELKKQVEAYRKIISKIGRLTLRVGVDVVPRAAPTVAEPVEAEPMEGVEVAEVRVRNDERKCEREDKRRGKKPKRLVELFGVPRDHDKYAQAVEEVGELKLLPKFKWDWIETIEKIRNYESFVDLVEAMRLTKPRTFLATLLDKMFDECGLKPTPISMSFVGKIVNVISRTIREP